MRDEASSSAFRLPSSALTSIRPITAADTRQFALPNPVSGAVGWVMGSPKSVAVAAFYPLPGLPHIAEMHLYTEPAQRRQGYASALLAHAHAHISKQNRAFKEISAAVGRLDSAEARFLLQRGYEPGHEEWTMTKRNLKPLSGSVARLSQYPLEIAIPRFRALYEDAFRSHPWYQPWETDDDVWSDLHIADEFLFLEHDGRPVAVIWVRCPQTAVAVLEPLGVLTAMQGQGFGRKLLVATLDRLARKQVRTVNLGVWRSNQPAIALYRSVGFIHTASHHYLSRSLQTT